MKMVVCGNHSPRGTHDGQKYFNSPNIKTLIITVKNLYEWYKTSKLINKKLQINKQTDHIAFFKPFYFQDLIVSSPLLLLHFSW